MCPLFFFLTKLDLITLKSYLIECCKTTEMLKAWTSHNTEHDQSSASRNWSHLSHLMVKLVWVRIAGSSHSWTKVKSWRVKLFISVRNIFTNIFSYEMPYKHLGTVVWIITLKSSKGKYITAASKKPPEETLCWKKNSLTNHYLQHLLRDRMKKKNKRKTNPTSHTPANQHRQRHPPDTITALAIMRGSSHSYRQQGCFLKSISTLEISSESESWKSRPCLYMLSY